MTGWNDTQPIDDEEADIVVLPAELETTVAAFLIGATQWRWQTVGFEAMPLGLDYAGLRAGCAMARLRLSADDFDGVQIMEAHALKVLARR